MSKSELLAIRSVCTSYVKTINFYVESFSNVLGNLEKIE